ncbi:F-box protein [Canna indica]|uniref:F-box protein n=1 Tax=Canna indica TaxID=4628 RepID=A0AAQ3K0K5_9LILI|nr:F-box protein [Canna indica]
MRSAAVCASWSAAVRELRSHRLHFRHLSPWLMFSGSGDENSSVASVISLSDQGVFTIPIPDPPMRDRFCIGSSHGWLIAANQQSDLQMLNPITGVQIDLPPVATIDHIEPIGDQQGCISGYLVHGVHGNPPLDFGLEDLRFYLYWKAILSSDPSQGDYTVVLIQDLHRRLSFARAGDNKWTTLSTSPLYFDAIFYKSKLYTVTEQTQRRFDFTYLVRSPSDELLQVARLKDDVDTDGDDYNK